MTTDLLERCLHAFTAGLHTADALTLEHEAERVEAMCPSPLVARMRAAVDAERDHRGGEQHG
jgi:hypothetical protein